MKILVINGPNLNLLGSREKTIYGSATLAEINELVADHAKKLGVTVEFYQSNEEGALVTRIGECGGMVDGIIFNPAAYTHTSVALRDALSAVSIPCVEVHLSNIAAREDFRKHSMVAGACIGQISGFGPHSYLLALDGLHAMLLQKRAQK